MFLALISLPVDLGREIFFLVSVGGFLFCNLGSGFLLRLRFGLDSFDDQFTDFEW